LRLWLTIPLVLGAILCTACGKTGKQPGEAVRPATDSTRTSAVRADTEKTSGGSETQLDTRLPTPDTHYDFSNPDTSFILDHDLEEISGLTVFDELHLAAVEDEHGRLYLIDFETGKITAERKFAGKGDYEGIERAGDRLFVLRSDGQLRELFEFETDDPKDDKFDLDLNSKCDAEGLAYQESQNRLLVSCKERAAKGLHRLRAIYSFKLESMKLDEDPVYLIRTDTVQAAIGAPGEALRELLAPLADLDGFKPSSIAINPVTGDLFVLSSVLKVIVVLRVDGTIKDIFILDDRLLRQPEGLTFLPNGDLFISSEGAGGDAVLARYNNKHR
jgi:uncharacterized protein YjiK